MSEFDVIVIGELNVDLILNNIDGFPETGKEKLAGEMSLTLGSSSAIFASNLSALGARVAFIGKTGADAFGDIVLQSLREKGVNTSMIIRERKLNTGATVVLNYDEDRAMITHPGAMNHLTADDIRMEELKRGRHLHISSPFLQPGIRGSLGQIFSLARELGLSTSLDTQWDPAEKWTLDLAGILPHVNIFLPNRQEALLLTGCQTVRGALQKLEALGAETIALKMDKEGSLCRFDGREIIRPPFLNKKVVDSIGAGDSFNAGFIFKYLQGSDIAKCQIFGNLTGAVNTTEAGGTTAFTSYADIMKIAAERFGYTESDR